MAQLAQFRDNMGNERQSPRGARGEMHGNSPELPYTIESSLEQLLVTYRNIESIY
jgi:hypothetical protein